MSARAPAVTTDSPRAEEPLISIDVDGALVRLRVERYRAELVGRIRELPGRRFVRERGEWAVPARRRALSDIATLVEDLGAGARVTAEARRRLDRVCPGRVDYRGGAFILTFPPRPSLLERVRTLPERRYVRDARCWTVSPNRAAALALLALLEEGNFAASAPVRARLRRLATARAVAEISVAQKGEERVRALRAPARAHWRHVTRGPIFEANAEQREYVAGIGWCVRVRVDPASGSGRQRGRR